MTPTSSSSIPISHSALSSLSASSSASSTSSPCAACKFLRRKCQPECVFAPYFPPDNPQKFVQVHRVFGASNVTKILNELPTHQREDAVNSLAYEADMRLRDPVYGCVGVISILQQQLRQLQLDLHRAKLELSRYQNHVSGSTLIATGGGGGSHGAVNININNNMGFGFPREGFLGSGRESGTNHYPYHHHPQHMVRHCDGEMAAASRMAVNGGGGYDNGMVATLGGPTSTLGVLGFLKPTSANGGEERPSIGPS